MQPSVVVEITQQARFQYAFPLALLGVVLIGGTLAAIAGAMLGVSQRMAGGIVIAVWLVGIGATIWYFSGAQGSIEVFPNELLLRPRLRRPIHLALPAERAEFSLWVSRGRSLRTSVVGPMLTMTSGETTVSVATWSVDLRESFPEHVNWPTTVLPPSFVVGAEGFSAILHALGLREGRGEASPQREGVWN
jgi:hypothetical protein